MNKKPLIIIALLFTLMVGVVVIIFILRNIVESPTTPNEESPTPTTHQYINRDPLFTQAQSFTALKKTSVGATTEAEVQSLPDVTKNGDNYNHPSPHILRPNEIIVENGIVVFEQVLIPEEQNGEHYRTITELKNQLGEPESVIQGSLYYDWYAETLIYAQLGIAAITNPYTDEVFELHFFIPTTTEDYVARFGKDIKEHTAEHGPDHP